ncbi:Vitamin B12 import ATP-binding protein BtuD [subsurface metagenome]
MTSEVRCFCRGLKKKYGRREVLRGCSFSLHAGELMGITGENGSGKSTLVRCLLGFLRPSSGEVRLDPSVGYCPQDNFLHGRLTLSEHLRLSNAILGGREAVDQEHLRWLLEVLRLEGFRDLRMAHLSGGSIQKVKFMTSILRRPHLIILDEPTDGFDWTMYLVYWDIMSKLRQEGAAVLMVSHLLYDRKQFDRLYELREGTLEETSRPVGGPSLSH